MNLSQNVIGNMLRLIEISKNEPERVSFSSESASIIHAVAEECRRINLDESLIEGRDEYRKFANDPYTVWIDIISKICDAPTDMHRDYTVIMLMPILDEMLIENASWVRG